MPKVWRPYFLSPNSPVTITDSMMLSGITATAVAAGLFTPEDGKVLVGRTDPQIINDSMALTIQCVASVSNMGRRMLEIMKFERCVPKLPFCNSA
uniref:Uncharacterized protein n=1 Tax=Fagus sylvatica TaxID=28930 RepID=A0A2N9GZW9_FAGSY